MLEKNFEIKLPVFEGPFDLLLFFIERDELDISNIPIAKITNEFLDYMHHMETMNIELASEFILVAATLMRIKAKMLLPRYSKDEQGNDIDPRQDLVQQLLDYKRYKEAAEEFRNKEEVRGQKVERGNVMEELKRIAIEAEQGNYQGELETLTLFKLLSTFEKVMDRFRYNAENNTHMVYQYQYTIEEQKDFIIRMARLKERCNFFDLFKDSQNKIHAIFTFLALLEMIQSQQVIIVIGEGFNNFWVTPPPDSEST